MTLWAIVPVKPLRNGKSRLAGVLSHDERTALNQLLLTHTVETLKTMSEIEQVLVISRDPAALALAREHSARTVMEEGAPKLNEALTRATLLVKTFAASGVLILPSDLPMLTPEDVRALIQRATRPPVVVIAPDRRWQGTNGLLISPVGLIPYRFGAGSFQQHCQGASDCGARLEICDLPSLALDVDLPEDLALVSDKLETLHFPKRPISLEAYYE